jgi:peptidoglycan hydrolase-like protein with peptidoglycan-binding domain
MEKNILNEIDSMKYLLGYKRGVVISEQDMDNSVDPKLVASAEQPVVSTDSTTPAATTDTAAPAATTDTAAPAATTSGPIKMGVVNPRVQYLQQLLNDKFQSGLVADGKYGPKTANAIYKNIIAISKTELKPLEPVNKTPQVIQQPAQQITANATIPQQ